MAEEKTCPICGEKVSVAPYDGGTYNLDCPRCGQFSISSLTVKFDSLADEKFNRANISGWIREHQGFQIHQRSLDMLAELKTPSVGAKGEKLLLWLAKINPKAGVEIEVLLHPFAPHVGGRLSETLSRLKQPPNFRPEILSVSWAQDHEELLYIFGEYLEKEMRFLENIRVGIFRITPKGWSHIYSLSQTNAQSNSGFIAMWFDEAMNDASLALGKGILDAGYEPLRIDQKQHNNKIDDEIVAAIRRSKFLVADFTGHRGGVYFEAGFAMGLGLPVIWLCRKDELEKTHFDARQYNFIVWEADKLAELSKNIQNRIEATIGRGVLQPAA
jgi:nucleoside 2-deoxyribosyltransferase